MSGSGGPCGSGWSGRLVAAISLVLVAGLVFLLWRRPSANSGPPGTPGAPAGAALMMYCAAGVRAPIERIVGRYRDECGVEVQVQYGGSNTLLSQIAVSRRGDLYLAGEKGYLDQGREKGLVEEVFALCVMRPVVGVRKGNPKDIHSCADLVREDVRLAVVSPDAGALGKVVRRELEPTSVWDRIHDAVQKRGVYKPNVMEVANDVKVGGADAAFVWDCTIAQMPGLEAVELPEFQGVREQFTLGVLKSAGDRTAALRFVRYLTAPDRGGEVFKACGYQDVIAGEPWQPPAGAP